jgi:perosamine synthetase
MFSSELADLQAALGLAQLERLPELVSRKQEIMGWYRDELQRDPRLTLNPELEGVENSYWMCTAVVTPALRLRKEDLIARLAERGIDSRPFFHPLSSLPAYADTRSAIDAKSRNVVAQRITPFGINLPSAFNLTRREVAYVASVLRELLDHAEDAIVRSEAA